MPGLLSTACVGVLAFVLGQGGCFNFNFNPPVTLDPPANSNSSTTAPPANSPPTVPPPAVLPPPVSQSPAVPCSNEVARNVVRRGGLTVTGTIDEVFNITTQTGDEVSSVHTEETKRIHVELNLRSADGLQFAGTAQVTWSNNYLYAHTSQFQTEGCPNPLETYHTHANRQWTVNIASASLECVDVEVRRC